MMPAERPGEGWKRAFTRIYNPTPTALLTSDEAGWRHAKFAEIALPPTGSYDGGASDNLEISLTLDEVKVRHAGKKTFEQLPRRPLLRWENLRGEWQAAANVIVLIISPDFLRGVLPSHTRLVEPPGFEAKAAKISHLMHLIRSDVKASSLAGPTVSESLISEIVALTFPDNAASYALESRSCRRQIRRVCEYIDANLSHRLSLFDLAEEASMSTRHLCRAFKPATGFAPHDYILRRRVEKARQLLTATELSLVEIAVMMGFSSHSHMTAAFRKITGTTPSHFRNK